MLVSVPSECLSRWGASPAVPPSPPQEHLGAVSREAAKVGMGGEGEECILPPLGRKQDREDSIDFFILIHLPASKQSSSPENICSSIFEQPLMVDAARHVDSGNRRPPGIESQFSAQEEKKQPVLKVVTVFPRKEDLIHIMTFVDASGDKAAPSNGCVQYGGRRKPSFQTFGNNNLKIRHEAARRADILHALLDALLIRYRT